MNWVFELENKLINNNNNFMLHLNIYITNYKLIEGYNYKK